MLWVLTCTIHLIECSYHFAYAFQRESTHYRCLNVKELLARNRCDIWNLSDWALLWVFICTVHLTECSYHFTYTFQSESTLYSCLNVKELLARNRRDIWNLNDCNGTWTHDHLVRKRTPHHLAKLTKWLSFVVSTYLYGAFDWMFLSCHVRVSEWIHTLKLPECLRSPCSKQYSLWKEYDSIQSNAPYR